MNRSRRSTSSTVKKRVTTLVTVQTGARTGVPPTLTFDEPGVVVTAGLSCADELDIRVRVGEIRHSSWAFEYAVDRADGVHCAEMSTVQVVIGAAKRAERMPDDLKLVLERAKHGS